MLARRENLSSILRTVSPGVPRGTRKPRTTPSSFAHTMHTSAIEPFVIQRLVPLMRNPPPAIRSARVIMPVGFEP